MNAVRSLFVLLTVSATSPAFAGGVAHVDAEAVIKAMPEYAAAQRSVETYGLELQKSLQKKQTDMQGYYQQTMQQVQSGMMTPQAQQAAEAKLLKMQEELQQAAAQADMALSQREADVLKPLYERFNNALVAVAKDNDYDYILDKKATLVANGPDATAATKKKLGI